MSDPTLSLCERCGLCCNGTLFHRVVLSEEEGRALASEPAIRLEIGEGGRTFLSQPCGALVGRSCSIYERRPRSCRVFDCKVLEGKAAGTWTTEQADDIVEEALRLIRERGVDALEVTMFMRRYFFKME